MTPGELRKRRDRLGLTQAEIAQVFGVHPNTWAKWERGDQPMRFPGVLRFALEQLADDHTRCQGDETCWRARLDQWATGNWITPD